MPDPFETAAQESHPKRKRRWFQYSLRTLLIFTFLLCVGMRWLALKAERQKAAVEAIKSDHGWVIYDYQLESENDVFASNSPKEPPGPGWLRRLLGDDWFTNVAVVNVRSDAGLRRIAGLDGLRTIRPVPSSLLDRLFVPVQRLAESRELHEELGDSIEISDIGLRFISKLQSLRHLDLSGTHVTDAGLSQLSGLANLETLMLNDTRITDAGLEHIKHLSRLEYLDLRGTAMTDAGLVHLKCMTQLKTVLVGPKVTTAGIRELQNALPNCKIWR